MNYRSSSPRKLIPSVSCVSIIWLVIIVVWRVVAIVLVVGWIVIGIVGSIIAVAHVSALIVILRITSAPVHVALVLSVRVVLVVLIVLRLRRIVIIIVIAILLWRRGLQEFLEGVEELCLIDNAVAVLVDGFDGFHGLLVIDVHIDPQLLKEVVEKESELLRVESPVPISVIFVENRVYVAFQDLVLKVRVLIHQLNYYDSYHLVSLIFTR